MTQKTRTMLIPGIAFILVAGGLLYWSRSASTPSERAQQRPVKEDTNTIPKDRTGTKTDTTNNDSKTASATASSKTPPEAKVPGGCGGGPVTQALAAGWVAEKNSYLCLSVAHPAGWKMLTQTDVHPIPGMIIPAWLGFDSDEDIPTYPVGLYPIAASAVIPNHTETVEKVRGSLKNVGSKDMEVYELVTPAQQGNFVNREYVLYAPSSQRAYYVAVTYDMAVRVKGQEIAPMVLRALKDSRTY